MRRYLLATLSGVILIALVLGAAATYRLSLWEADQISDYQLRQVALSLRDQDFRDTLPPYTAAAEEQFDLVIQAWDRYGTHLYLSHPHSDLPDRAQLGYTTLTTSEGAWRVFSIELRHHVIQVAQPMRVRERLAANMALHLVLPFLVLLPVLGFLVWLAVGRGLRPLAAVTRAVTARSPASLEPLSTGGVPEEILPLVQSLNDLLGRLGHSLETLRAFTADAAHELRTPLAALQLQVQLTERARSDSDRQAALSQLKDGLKRATHVVEQLLTLARQEPGVPDRPFVSVDLVSLAGRVVAEHAALAEAGGIDLGLDETQEGVVAPGDPAALAILLANLVNNAIRHTPAGGRVDVAVGNAPDGAWMEVRDTGVGIPPEDRARVFDRFYRREGTASPGSGLGLAIVRQIALRHGAQVSLDDGPGGVGLRARVVIP
jgi:two-component system OmpR family sensor kinase